MKETFIDYWNNDGADTAHEMYNLPIWVRNISQFFPTNSKLDNWLEIFSWAIFKMHPKWVASIDFICYLQFLDESESESFCSLNCLQYTCCMWCIRTRASLGTIKNTMGGFFLSIFSPQYLAAPKYVEKNCFCKKCVRWTAGASLGVWALSVQSKIRCNLCALAVLFSMYCGPFRFTWI